MLFQYNFFSTPLDNHFRLFIDVRTVSKRFIKFLSISFLPINTIIPSKISKVKLHCICKCSIYSLSFSTTVFVESQTYKFLFISFSLHCQPIKNLTLLTFSVIVGTSNYKCRPNLYVHYCYIFVLKPRDEVKNKM